MLARSAFGRRCRAARRCALSSAASSSVATDMHATRCGFQSTVEWSEWSLPVPVDMVQLYDLSLNLYLWFERVHGHAADGARAAAERRERGSAQLEETSRQRHLRPLGRVPELVRGGHVELIERRAAKGARGRLLARGSGQGHGGDQPAVGGVVPLHLSRAEAGNP
eukprot:scaffold29954_cov80-Phaeocystis_antarctica.AAC.2